MNDPTRFPDGVSTVTTGPLRDFPYPDVTKMIMEFEDFHRYTAAEWTVTETDAGATEALTAGLGGWLLITNTAADDDRVNMQTVRREYQLTKGKKTFFEARFKVSDALQSDVIFGLIITDTTPTGFTDGISMYKRDGETTVALFTAKDSVVQTTGALGLVVTDTFQKWSFYYDGKDLHFYIDGLKKGTILAAGIPDDELLQPTIFLQNGEAVAKTLTVDYYLVAQER